MARVILNPQPGLTAAEALEGTDIAHVPLNPPQPAPRPGKGALTVRRVNLTLLKDCIEWMGQALATHHHVWTPAQRRNWERAWVEIRRQMGDPTDPPIPMHQLPHRGVIRKDYVGAPVPSGVSGPAASPGSVRKVI